VASAVSLASASASAHSGSWKLSYVNDNQSEALLARKQRKKIETQSHLAQLAQPSLAAGRSAQLGQPPSSSLWLTSIYRPRRRRRRKAGGGGSAGEAQRKQLARRRQPSGGARISGCG